MRPRVHRIFGLFIVFCFLGNAAASADFEGPFAPSQWTFQGSASGNSLTSSQLQIISKDGSIGFHSASYSVNVPGNISSINFTYNYSTVDIDDSGWDMAKYSVNGVVTDFVPGNITSQSGTISLTNVSGTSFAIIQDSLDGILGSGTITITNFQASYRPGDFLRSVDAPKLTITEDKATCLPGTYKMASGSKVDISSIVYALVVNGQPVSRIAYDPSNSIAPHMFSSIKHTVDGVASIEQAIWDITKLSNFDAYCEVTVTTKFGSMANTSSNLVTDSAKLAAIEAKKVEEEKARLDAVAANYTKEMREMRKRMRERAGN